jgi:hypothetical protein
MHAQLLSLCSSSSVLTYVYLWKLLSQPLASLLQAKSAGNRHLVLHREDEYYTVGLDGEGGEDRGNHCPCNKVDGSANLFSTQVVKFNLDFLEEKFPNHSISRCFEN